MKPNVEVWHHGGEIEGPLRSMYLTPSKALASLHGDLHSFMIDPGAKWLDTDKVEYFIPGMDSLGYTEGWDEKLRNKGYDVVWDSSDYKRGHQQIYVVNPEVLKNVDTFDESTHVDDLLFLLEDTGEVDLDSLQPRDVVTVYHGTTPKELARMINGFDARQVYRRVYGGPEHRGIFVTPSFQTAREFGSGVVLEIKTYAKFLHGTDWSGNIGRETVPKGSELQKRWAERYPNSFRPWLSHTLQQSGEPQALLIGVVKPSQITKIFYRKPGENEFQEYTREEFLKQGFEHSGMYAGGKWRGEEFVDLGVDLSNPNLKLKDWLMAVMQADGRDPDMYDRTLNFFKIYAKRGRDVLEDRISEIELGGSRLGELALKSIVDQIMDLVEQEKTTSESIHTNKTIFTETMSKKKLIKEQTISSYRLRKLAGILKENEEPELLRKSKEVMDMWLKKEGMDKIVKLLEKEVEEYYAQGNHVDADEDGVHHTPPLAEYFTEGETLLDAFAEDIAKVAKEVDPELGRRIWDWELPKEVEEMLARTIEDAANKVFDDVAGDVADAYGDSYARSRDPYSYYGVRRSDFY